MAKGGGMRSRAVTTISALLLGLAGTPALAQLLPLPVPRMQQPPFQPPPPVEVEDEAPPYDPPPGYRRVPNPQYGRGYPQDVETNQLPPPGGYREQPVPGYEPIEPDPRGRVGRSYGDQQPGYQPGYEPDPRGRYGRPGYDQQPGYQQGYQQPGYQQPGNEPDPRGRFGGAEQRPGYEPEPRQGLLPNPLDILRPPAPVGRQQEPVGRQQEGRQQEGRQQEGRPQQGGVYAALPPEDRPETGPMKELPQHLRRTVVNFQTREPVGTIVIDT